MTAPINLRSSHALLLLVACGQSVLSHTLDDGEHLVTFTSCKLMKAKKNYCQIKEEACTCNSFCCEEILHALVW